MEKSRRKNVKDGRIGWAAPIKSPTSAWRGWESRDAPVLSVISGPGGGSGEGQPLCSIFTATWTTASSLCICIRYTPNKYTSNYHLFVGPIVAEPIMPEGVREVYPVREASWHAIMALLFLLFLWIVADPESSIGFVRSQCSLMRQSLYDRIRVVVARLWNDLIALMLPSILDVYSWLTDGHFTSALQHVAEPLTTVAARLWNDLITLILPLILDVCSWLTDGHFISALQHVLELLTADLLDWADYKAIAIACLCFSLPWIYLHLRLRLRSSLLGLFLFLATLCVYFRCYSYHSVSCMILGGLSEPADS